MSFSQHELESQLNDLDPNRRRDALEQLHAAVLRGDIELPSPRNAVNLHAHTFFSFNGYGYSPTYFAWRARKEGLAVAGIVDFDVLDGVDEFFDACRLLDLPATAGLETRVFVPDFADLEINSPGEPGIAYHMGAGFTSSTPRNPELLEELRAMASERTRTIMDRVNAHVAPATLVYDRDVVPLTPAGNATERHLCMAYARKAETLYPQENERAAFWANKLNESAERMLEVLTDPPRMQALIRSKLMKSGGPGYIQAEGTDFPRVDRVNDFVLAERAIPTLAWLDGLSAAETDPERLLNSAVAAGAAAVNVIPDRNWNVGNADLKRRKMANIESFIHAAKSRDLPIMAGTEMNAYGQPFVDDFDAPELEPFVSSFIEGARILYAHTLLESIAGMGYLSDWSKRHFATAALRNAYYTTLGMEASAVHLHEQGLVHAEMRPDEVSAALQGGGPIR